MSSLVPYEITQVLYFFHVGRTEDKTCYTTSTERSGVSHFFIFDAAEWIDFYYLLSFQNLSCVHSDSVGELSESHLSKLQCVPKQIQSYQLLNNTLSFQTLDLHIHRILHACSWSPAVISLIRRALLPFWGLARAILLSLFLEQLQYSVDGHAVSCKAFNAARGFHSYV